MQTHRNTPTRTHVGTWKCRNTFGPLSDLLKGVESHMESIIFLFMTQSLLQNQSQGKYL